MGYKERFPKTVKLETTGFSSTEAQLAQIVYEQGLTLFDPIGVSTLSLNIADKRQVNIDIGYEVIGDRRLQTIQISMSRKKTGNTKWGARISATIMNGKLTSFSDGRNGVKINLDTASPVERKIAAMGYSLLLAEISEPVVNLAQKTSQTFDIPSFAEELAR